MTARQIRHSNNGQSVAGGAKATKGARGGHLFLGAAAFVGAGLATAVFGGFPLWAARNILYPAGAEPLPGAVELTLATGELIEPEKVQFRSTDGKLREGLFAPAPHDVARPWPAVALAHGYGGYKEQMIGYAQLLHDAGFATLMFDMRGGGAGNNREAPVTLGYKERFDVSGACRYLAERPEIDAERVGAMGVSMGAAAVLQAAEHDPSIKVIVSDSSYADIERMIKPGLQAFLGPLAVPFAPIIIWHAQNIVGARASEIVPERSAARLGNRPLFVIHGADDPLISAESAHRIYDAASGPKELWVVPNCTHADAPAVAPEEYKQRVGDFMRRYL